jgi:hypothetical protein
MRRDNSGTVAADAPSAFAFGPDLFGFSVSAADTVRRPPGYGHARRVALARGVAPALSNDIRRTRRPQDRPAAAEMRGNADETILGNPRNHPETERAYCCCQRRGGKVALEAQMNHSIHSADRSTHLKIVVVALVAGIAVAAFGISARTGADYSQTAQVVKAGKAMTVTSTTASLVR